MKNFRLILISFALIISTIGLSQVTIGNDTLYRSAPVNPYYGYSYTQVIYLASEIGMSGNITSLTYYAKPTTIIDNSNDWIVYIGHTTKTAFYFVDWVPVDSLTQSFAGTVTIVGGQVKIILDTPFAYNGTDNLVIAVEENKPGFNSYSDAFYATATGIDPRTIGVTSDSFDPDPISAIGMGFTEPSIANITIDFGTTGIDNPTNKNTVFNLYPNPTNGLFKIKNPLEEKITVEVKNVQGEVVYKETSKTSILPIDLKQNAKGIYFVTITSNDENNTFKLVVQ